jgi:hypothetical protein
MQRDDLGVVTLKTENLLAGLDVPELGGVVHGASGDEHAVRVERETDDFHLVAFKSVVALAGIRIPNLGFPVKGARDDFVSVKKVRTYERHLPEGVVESHCVDDIGVLVEGEQFCAGVSVPDFTGAIVTTRDELASIFVESAVSQGQ